MADETAEKKGETSLAHPPPEILEELGEDEEEYEDLEVFEDLLSELCSPNSCRAKLRGQDEQDEEESGYEDADGEFEDEDSGDPGESLTSLLIGTGGPEVDEDDEDDADFDATPAPNVGAKRAREAEEDAQAAGDETSGYITDVNTDTDVGKTKKAKTD